MTTSFQLPDLRVPSSIETQTMPDLLRYWYLGTRARRNMMLRRFREVDAELRGSAGDRVLDVGCAWGYNVMALNRLGYHATGIDLVSDQFAVGQKIARENDAAFPVLGADVSHLPFENGVFDFVTMVETLEHIFVDDQPAALAECFRVLKKSGRLVLSTPNYHGAVERLKRFAGGRRRLRDRLPTMCYPEAGTSRRDYHPYRYHHPLPDDRIGSLLESAGFRIERVKRFLFVLKSTPDWLYWPTEGVEKVFERLPGIRGLAATICFVAQKTGN